MVFFSQVMYVQHIRGFGSPKCKVNPQPNTRVLGPLVGRTSGNRRRAMHILAVILSITCHFFSVSQKTSRGLYGLVEKY